MKNMPKIQKYMTAMPHTVGADIPVKVAHDMMRKYGIRHLPVQKAGKLVGVLTDRDVKLAAQFQGPSGELTVDDVMTPDPYVATPEASVDQVAMAMAEHKYGCAIVQQKNEKVVGIFTYVDALRVLADVLRQNYKNDAA